MRARRPQRMHEEPENPLLDKLISLLEALEPSEHEAHLAHLLAEAERFAARPSRVEQNGDSGLAALRIERWASDLGSEGTVQRLGVDTTPGPVRVLKTRAATGRPLLSNGYLGADILHVTAGDGFAPHTHPGDHLLFVLAGCGTITVDGTITETGAGQVYLIEGAVPHAVGAITDHVILAIGAPHMPLDSEARQDLTAYEALLTSMGSITCTICGVAGDGADALAERGCTHSPDVY
jgi:quercetin dioxygenase-like cupin family protein